MSIKYQNLKKCCLEYIFVEWCTNKIQVANYDTDWWNII